MVHQKHYTNPRATKSPTDPDQYEIGIHWRVQNPNLQHLP